MTRGFPVPVRYNGVFLRRPHAPDALPFVETSIGAVHLAGVEDGAATWETAVYLQGLMIEGPIGLGFRATSCTSIRWRSGPGCRTGIA